MPAPTNIDFANATDLGSLPASVTQDVNFGGVTYNVYYKFTASTTGVVSIWARGPIPAGVGIYNCNMTPYIGPLGSETPWPFTVDTSQFNRPSQIPVDSGVTYFIEITRPADVATAILELDVQYFVAQAVITGSLMIPDDSEVFPAAILSSSTGEVLRFDYPFPPGEAGVSEPSIGAVLVDDNTSTERKFKLYTSTLSYTGFSLAHPTATGHSGSPTVAISFGRATNSFYAGWISSAGTMTLKRLSVTDLTELDSWTIASVTNTRAIAISPDETFMYLSGVAGLSGSAISKYDLVGSAFVADFAATIANYIAPEILCLSDGTVVVVYDKTTVTRDVLVKTYDSTGSVLQSQSFGSAIDVSSVSRGTYAINDPDSFWLWRHNSDGTDTIFNIQTADLSATITLTTTVYEQGTYQPAENADPVLFGHSQSCPIFVLRGADVPITTFTIRRLRRGLLPQSDMNRRMKIPTLQLLMRTGIGLLPDATDSPTPLGVDPQVMLRISKDGGKTWLPERWMSAGERGQFKDRVRWQQATGNYRNGVFEIVVTDPVDWQMLALLGEPEEGPS